MMKNRLYLPTLAGAALLGLAASANVLKRRKSSGAKEDLERARAAWAGIMAKYNNDLGIVDFTQILGDFPVLGDEHVENCRMLSTREKLILEMKKGGHVAEVGVQKGTFSQHILENISPAKLHLFDLNFQKFKVAERFAEQIKAGQVILHEGDSSTELAKLPDRYFDFIYIDGNHSYEGVQGDIAVAKTRIKEDGYLIFNDYTFWSPAECIPYGVVQAVNELCLKEGWKLEYFALGWGMYCDVAVRKSRSIVRQSGEDLSEIQIRKYYPYPAQRALENQSVLGIPPEKQAFYILKNQNANGHEYKTASMAVPPKPLRHGYGDTEEIWLNGGHVDVDKMMATLNSSGFVIQTGYRVLDFGCASGRMIRWFVDLAETCEIWGVDINAHLIAWCHENLSPPFNFVTVTTLPHLPFEDQYFDLIYCGSVFTHIDDLADAWLLEIKRIMRPGGRAYITVLDKHTADLIMNQGHDIAPVLREFDKYVNFKKADYDILSIFPGSPASQVFYDINYLCKRWGRMLKIVSITQEAYWQQTAVLLEKEPVADR